MNQLLVAMALWIIGAVLSLFAGKRSSLATRCGVVSGVLAGSLAAVGALQVLLTGVEQSWRLPWTVPVGSFSLHLDPLAACFVLPIAVLSSCCALYGGAYLKEEGNHRSLAPHWFFFNLLAASLTLVVTAANAVFFLLAWESMTLSSFFLVAWDHQHAEVRQAAWVYLMAAHLGVMLLLALFNLAGSHCGGFDFSDFGPLAQLPPTDAAVLFLLALFGFGVKAGLFPLHIWLPDAHPAAPSHVSALMSGVLVKTGIYGILRVLSLLPPAPSWWGWLIAGLGIAGALYGISLALLQRDIKRCLAYSTVENVGIILLGIGFGLVASAQGHPTLALFAFAGGMLHIWNHALFKGLMFLGAGALFHATGTRDMNRMGGLLRRMPLVGLLWIGGSLAMSALPPLNGLVSEWLIYLGLAGTGTTQEGFIALAPLLLFGMLGLVGALSLVAFTRLIGICLLGEPRDPAAALAHEAPPAMWLPMGLLLAGCLTIGLFPRRALQLLSEPLAQVARIPVGEELGRAVLPLGWGALLLILALLLTAGLLVGLRRCRPTLTNTTWSCGFRFPSPRISYTGGSYAELVFRHLLPGSLCPERKGGKVKGIFPAPAKLTLHSTDPALERILRPLFVDLADRCQRLRWLQQGRMHIYLLYIFIASTVLMAWSLWAGGKGG